MTRCVIFGAGQHARVLLMTITSNPAYGVVGDEYICLDKNENLHGEIRSGHYRVKVYGYEAFPSNKLHRNSAMLGVSRFIVGVGGVRSISDRQDLYNLGLLDLMLYPESVSHRTSLYLGRDRGDGCQLMANCMVGYRTKLGRNVLVNTGAIIDHDCEIGDHTHVAPGAVLSGGVRVGECSHIGTNATVIQGVRIGDRVTVGAGAVVTQDVPDCVTVVGVPAEEIQP